MNIMSVSHLYLRRCHLRGRLSSAALFASVSFKLSSTATVAVAVSSGTNLLPYIGVLICFRARTGPVIPDNSLRVYNKRARAYKKHLDKSPHRPEIFLYGVRR